MTITLATLTLPDNLSWQDETAFSGALATNRRTLQGRLIMETGQIFGGRPITLGGEAAWIRRADLLLLLALAADPDGGLTLTLHDGRRFTVRFRHWDKPEIDAAPLQGLADPDDDTLYVLSSVKLAEV